MNVTLICPSFFDLNNNVFRTKTALVPPLSIYYLAGFVPPEDEVRTVDDAVEEIDFDAKTDLAALTTTTTNARRAYEIADEYRKRNVKVVLGGIHATLLPEEALQHADAVVLGEAEDAWPELLRDLKAGKLKSRYQGIPRDSLENLPLPRFDLIDRSHYFRPPFRKSPLFPIYTSRGCPHDCSFCSVTKFWGKKMRFRPVAEVVAEIKQSGADTIFFTDDNFVINPKRAMELCAALEPLRIKFLCQIDTLSRNRDEVYRALKRAGCFMVFVGFERIDEQKLGELNKRFNAPEDYLRFIKTLHKNGIGVYASLIFGLEGDSPVIVRRTVDFLINARVEIAAFFPITPFPGTDFFVRIKQSGQLLDDRWWLHPIESGKEGLVRYAENQYNEYDLCRLAMGAFYSFRSIVRRFWLFRPHRLLPLLLNFSSRIKARNAKEACVL